MVIEHLQRQFPAPTEVIHADNSKDGHIEPGMAVAFGASIAGSYLKNEEVKKRENYGVQMKDLLIDVVPLSLRNTFVMNWWHPLGDPRYIVGGTVQFSKEAVASEAVLQNCWKAVILEHDAEQAKKKMPSYHLQCIKHDHHDAKGNGTKRKFWYNLSYTTNGLAHGLGKEIAPWIPSTRPSKGLGPALARF